MALLNLLEETRFEKIPVSVYPNQQIASHYVARQIAELIKEKQDSNTNAVLGLATGMSPLKVYKELIRLHREEGLSFRNVITFNLDEYFPMMPGSAQSYVDFMNKNLFDHIDIKRCNIHIPDGMCALEEMPQYCLEYERKIREYGGLDLQLLGIGRTGHIGFNEPGSAPNSGTRLVTLDDLTRRDASHDFGGKANVPTKAITMGIGTIFHAHRIILLAWNTKKASIIKKAIEGNMSSDVPATFLQLSESVEFILDQGAASELTRFDTPWLVRDCIWDRKLIKKAIIWLSRALDKPILKLTEDDYNNNGMAELATERGPVNQINIAVFNQVQHTITGWPGGKADADDLQRPERALPDKKQVLVFSPHPDDDAICMGGTLSRLIEQQHHVHVAYQTSGNNGVWDDDALRFMQFFRDFGKMTDMDTQKIDYLYHDMREFIENKQPRQLETPELQLVKSLIRKGEAISGARFMGLDDRHVHFMNLPFYEKIKVAGYPNLEEDVELCISLLQKLKPHQIFAAGDFDDPHGTHKVCFNIIVEALNRLKAEPWISDCWLWLYRGAWNEFEIHEIDMAVPLSPQELKRKRLAIFKHQSQKHHPVFPGDDSREFWLRAESRSRETAEAYDKLGMANYEALEAFVKYDF